MTTAAPGLGVFFAEVCERSYVQPHARRRAHEFGEGMWTDPVEFFLAVTADAARSQALLPALERYGARRVERAVTAP